MNDGVAGKLLDAASSVTSQAIKAGPVIFTQIISTVLILVFVIGIAWFVWEKDKKTGAYIMGKEARIEDLQKQLLEAVRECNSAPRG